MRLTVVNRPRGRYDYMSTMTTDIETREADGRTLRPQLFTRAGVNAIVAPVLMHILGLPLPSFIVLIVIPAIVVAYQFFYCWQVYTGRRD